ncbi:DNA-directed RNA polymerase subunit beta [Nocardia sp. Marseille-Q1738]
MPEPLGQAVKGEMQRRDVDLGPILSHPRSRRWTYLIRPNLPDEVSLFAEMFRLNVSVVRDGGTIALPSPADQCVEFRHWVEPPRCMYRPSGLAVVDAIRACAGPGRFRAVTHV